MRLYIVVFLFAAESAYHHKGSLRLALQRLRQISSETSGDLGNTSVNYDLTENVTSAVLEVMIR